MELFSLYHQLSKNKREKSIPTPPPSDWPEEWKTVIIKTYPRFACYTLPKPTLPQTSLSDTLLLRSSNRDFTSDIDIQILSTLLYYSIGKKEKKDEYHDDRRMYPSAGALYPLEFYVVIFKPIEHLSTGVYHYNLEKHGLVLVKKVVFNEVLLDSFARDGYAKKAAFAVVMTATFGRSVQKYGERAYRFILLEAGGVAQNVTLVATSLGIGSLQMGGLIDETAEEMFGIDGSNESTIHAVFFG